MERSIPLVHIRVRHDYYASAGWCVRIGPTTATEALAARRGLLWIQLSHNEWQLLVREDHPGFDAGDAVELEMSAPASEFFRVTDLGSDFSPSYLYSVDLNGCDAEVDLASLLKLPPAKEPAKRREADNLKWGTAFCRLGLRLDDGLLSAARTGNPKRCTLRLRPRSFVWEYLFVFCSPEGVDPRKLKLAERSGTVAFTPFEAVPDSSLGRGVFQCVSTAAIPAARAYGYELILEQTVRGEPPLKRTVSRFIGCPVPGKYLAGAPDMICQICFI